MNWWDVFASSGELFWTALRLRRENTPVVLLHHFPTELVFELHVWPDAEAITAGVRAVERSTEDHVRVTLWADCFVGSYDVDEGCYIPVSCNLMNVVQVILAWSYLDYCAFSPFDDFKEANVD